MACELYNSPPYLQNLDNCNRKGTGWTMWGSIVRLLAKNTTAFENIFWHSWNLLGSAISPYLNFQKPNITSSVSDRVQIAAAAIEKIRSTSNTSEGLFSDLANISFGISATFYSQLAEFDLIVNQTTYEDAVQNYFPLAEASRPGLLDEFVSSPSQMNFIMEVIYHPFHSSSVKQMNYGLANGYAAIRAYMIYNNDTFLAYAEECWNSNQAYALTDADFSGTFALKDFPLQSSCQGITMAGGVFWETDINNPSIDGLGTGVNQDTSLREIFLMGSISSAKVISISLSALLAKATSNQTYLIAAQTSATFIKAHLYNINGVVQDTISARENDSCSTSGNMWPYNAGLMIEGLATLYSFTQNATMQSLLNDAIVAAVQNTVWVADSGIIASGTQKLGDNMLARGLLVAYSHNATSAEIRTYIEAFLGVQYNAIIDLATANGTNIYTASWATLQAQTLPLYQLPPYPP
ncbi:hypothetical protein C8J55DRAFT_555018 [Lentinula edodes]|uniref:Glycoside hydrolase family 76 protein n=1 Tax=Lentinula lateritia TaxID=40482 RepID=A0A9W9B0C1_9AGAR|nr:hypothetical protein C8J55DRAFT_555018 [Lentinula edodes]